MAFNDDDEEDELINELIMNNNENIRQEETELPLNKDGSKKRVNRKRKYPWNTLIWLKLLRNPLKIDPKTREGKKFR